MGMHQYAHCVNMITASGYAPGMNRVWIWVRTGYASGTHRV